MAFVIAFFIAFFIVKMWKGLIEIAVCLVVLLAVIWVLVNVFGIT